MSVISTNCQGDCITCETCFHGDSRTIYCHKHNEFASLEQYNSGCADYVDINKALSEIKCPKCGSTNIVCDDVDELNEQAFIECNDCDYYIVEDNRYDAIKRWINMSQGDF